MSQRPETNRAQVRSMTFNIRGITAEGAEEIISAIVERDPDVVLFHEVDTDKQRSGLSRIDLIRRRVDEETRKAKGSCPASDVVFGAEVRSFANAILTRNGFTVAAGEEVETVPSRHERSGGRLRLSDVPPALVVLVKAPNGHAFSIVSTNQTSKVEPDKVSALTRQAQEQSRMGQRPPLVLLDVGANEAGLREITLR